MKPNAILGYALAILCLLILLYTKRSGDIPAAKRPATASQTLSGGGDNDAHIPRPQKEKGNEPADALLSEDISVKDKLVVFERFFMDYLSAHHSLPSGTQEEIYDALTGNNPKGIAYIPSGHPITKSQDFTFHSLSSKAIEILHRGEDGVFYSEDDVVSSPFASVEVKR